MLFQRLRLYFLHLTKTRTATWHLKKLQLYCSQGSSVQMYPTMLYKRSWGKSKKRVSRMDRKELSEYFMSRDTTKSAWKRYQETTVLVYSSKKLTKSYGMSFCNQISPKIVIYRVSDISVGIFGGKRVLLSIGLININSHYRISGKAQGIA